MMEEILTVIMEQMSMGLFFAFPGRLIALFSKYSLYFKIVVLIEILIYIGSSILFKKYHIFCLIPKKFQS
jgi:hypothetical protein